MASVFTRILDGELPGRFVWRDDHCAAFLTINPLRPGHTLVVPRQEVGHWIDLEPGLLHHLMDVAQEIGRAVQNVWSPRKVGVALVGLEVEHVHIHVTPVDSMQDLDFARADHDPDPDALDEAAERLREALQARGAAGVTS